MKARAKGGLRRFLTALALGAATLPAAGCFDDATEVVVVVDTDVPATEIGAVTFVVTNPSTGSMQGAGTNPQAQAVTLPATVGVLPDSSSAFANDFNVTVALWPVGVNVVGGGMAFSNQGIAVAPLVTRKAAHVAFKKEHQLLLFLPLSRRCSCQGTNCPHALEPDCNEIVSPTLPGFDPDSIPRFASASSTAP